MCDTCTTYDIAGFTVQENGMVRNDSGTIIGRLSDLAETSKGVALLGQVDRIVRSQYHDKCHDCGQFLKEEKWVAKNHQWKKHALCAECLSAYDYPEY